MREQECVCEREAAHTRVNVRLQIGRDSYKAGGLVEAERLTFYSSLHLYRLDRIIES